MQKIKVVAVDDYHLIREGIKACFAQQEDVELVAMGAAGEDILPLIEQYRPDAILLDYKLPPTKNSDRKDFKIIPLLEKIHRDYPELYVIVVSALDDGLLIKCCLEAGASGFLSKNDTENGFTVAIRAVVQNGLFLSETAAENYANAPESILTRRQLQVLQLIDRFPDIKDYQKLGDMLTISDSTFKKHLTHAMRRLGTPNNRHAALKRATTLNLLG